MATNVPIKEPAELRAGTNWKWRREDLTADYPASSWVLTYFLKRLAANGNYLSVVASADGDVFEVNVVAANTQAYVAGDYSWSALVASGSDTYEVGRGTIRILPRYDTANAYDDRSHARKALDAIEAVLEGRASLDQESYSIQGRSLVRTPIAQLLKFRDVYRQEVRREQIAAQLASGINAGKRVLIRG